VSAYGIKNLWVFYILFDASDGDC